MGKWRNYYRIGRESWPRQRINNHIREVQLIAEGGQTVRDPVIVESWRRCVRDYGLDPLELKEAYIRSPIRASPTSGALEQLIRTARYGVEALYQQIAGQRYVLLLTDAKGVTVDYIGDGVSKRNCEGWPLSWLRMV